MEGQTVGQPNTDFSDEEALNLLWPMNLIVEIHHEKTQHLWATPLAVVNYIIAALVALALGPMQLVLLVFTEDYLLVTEVYFYTALRVSFLLSALLAISTIVAMVQTWREQPPRSTSTVILGAGTAAVIFIIWLASFTVDFTPTNLSIIMILLIAITGVAALATARHFYSTEKPHAFLNTSLLTVSLAAVVETVLVLFFLFQQFTSAERVQAELEQLGKAQIAARIDGISTELSDLVFTICHGYYDPIYIPSDDPTSGLFECRGSHRVFSVSGPNAPTTDIKTDTILLGSAFYFGTTSDELISTYFSPESGAKYLYRELSDASQPDELVLLLPAASEEILVNAYLEPLLGLINARAKNNDLIISIFYSNETNNVLTTKDFIVMAAADTLALVNYLPDGSNLRGYINGYAGTYIYSVDTSLTALTILASSPYLYSSQTLDALTLRRHINITIQKDQIYTADSLRDMLYASFRDPVGSNTENISGAIDEI